MVVLGWMLQRYRSTQGLVPTQTTEAVQAVHAIGSSKGQVEGHWRPKVALTLDRQGKSERRETGLQLLERPIRQLVVTWGHRRIDLHLTCSPAQEGSARMVFTTYVRRCVSTVWIPSDKSD